MTVPHSRRGLARETSTRDLFRALVGEARDELGQRPSPLATGYLVDLLDARVRSSGPAADSSGARTMPATLAEGLVEALLVEGSSRWSRLRALGDRALFDAGFFGESLRRRAVGIDYYSDIGRTAYLRLSAAPDPGDPAQMGREAPPDLFHELAQHFADFVELLAEVAERARGRKQVDLLRLYERYRETGSWRDRDRLLRHGLILPGGRSEGRPQ
jgi:hypothetical protein